MLDAVIVEPLCSEQRGLPIFAVPEALPRKIFAEFRQHKAGLFQGFLHEAASTNSPLATFAIAIG
jgi:hypothetical protein